MDDGLFAIWRSLRTMMQMLKDRGYQISDEDLNTDYDGFVQWAQQEELTNDNRSALTATYTKPNGDSIATIWYSELNFGNSAIQNIHSVMKDLGVTRAIVVIRGKITAYADAAIRNLKVNKIHIQIFTQQELQFNVTHHRDVPRHIICSLDKKNKIMQTYAIKNKEQLPQIKVTDPQCRYLGAERGQLLKIVRPSLTTPRVLLASDREKELYSISFRIVV